MKYDEKKRMIICGALLLYFIIIIGTEPLYRQSLYDHSITAIKEIRENLTDFQYSFFRVITEFGAGIFIPMMIIIFIWFPLNKSYAFFRIMCASVFLNSLLKLIYSNPRPYWTDSTLFKVCEGGYGNPSGHSMGSMANWLALAHTFTDYEYFKSENLILKYVIYIMTILLILSICVSRVVLAAHSINQVVYGGLLGLGLYVFLYHAIKIDNFKGKEFFGLFRRSGSVIVHSICYIVLLSIAVILYVFIDRDNTEYEAIINNYCPNIPIYRRFQNEGMTGSLLLVAFMGSYYSMVFLAHYIETAFKEHEDDINEWHLGQTLSQFLRILASVAICVFPIALMKIVSGENSMLIIYLFKLGIPTLLLGFLVFGINIWICLKLKIGNPMIYKLPGEEFKQVNIANDV
jgi:membrane-associated phospholipid phosphatase